MRKTKFKWFTNKTHKHLTKRAKLHLKQKLKKYYALKRGGGGVIKGKYFRYTAIKLWSCKNSDVYFPQLELKAHIYSLKPRPREEISKRLNFIINSLKKDYDFHNFFEFELTRRRIAYEYERVSKGEYQKGSMGIITVWNSRSHIRSGFPKTRWFKFKKE